MKQIKTVDDIKQLGTILCVWAHPDDETFSCAGIMAAAVKNNQTVVCLTATKGELGIQDPDRWPAEKLGQTRAMELSKALHCIGCNNHHWLGYADGSCDEVSDQEGAAKIREFIDKYHPDSILTFGPEGMTGHLDHKAVSRWATLAAGKDVQVYYSVEDEEVYENYLLEIDQRFNFFFNIDKPPVKQAKDCDIAFSLTPELCKIKESALRAMPSQFDAFFEAVSPEQIQAITRLECFVKV